MKKTLKWLAISIVGLCVLIVATLLVIPMFVDLNDHKPRIEAKVSELTGRPFSIGGELDLSLFPWAGISFSDLKLGNPPGFEEKDFVSIDSFEVRVKLLPLLSKDIQVNRFVMERPFIQLVSNSKGEKNWQGLGGKPGEKAKEEKKDTSDAALSIKSLAVGECAIRDGSLIWIDKAKDQRKEIRDLNIMLEGISLDSPVGLEISASIDGRPLSVNGKVGPVGKDPGKGEIPVDLLIAALDEVELALKGQIASAAQKPSFDIDIRLSEFSPRKLLSKLDMDFPVKTKDPEALSKFGMECKLKGSTDEVSISSGRVALDETSIDFSLRAKDFSRPDLAFDIKIDRIDLEPYMPPPSKEGEKTEAKKGKSKGPDYEPLRKLVLDGNLAIKEMIAQGAKIEDLTMKVTARGGVFKVRPLEMRLYEGALKMNARASLKEDTPSVSLITKETDYR